MFNATLFTRGSIHQGDSRFSDISRGRQCAFMSLSALLCANRGDISTWTAETMDRVLASRFSSILLLIKTTSFTLFRPVDTLVW